MKFGSMLMMQKMKEANKKKRFWPCVLLAFSFAVGLILGFIFDDKQDSEKSSLYIIDNNPSCNRDTVLVRDTIYRVKTIIKWRYKVADCCCTRHKCNNNNERLDSI